MKDEFDNLLLDTQKEYSRSNRMKDKIIVVLIVLMFLEAIIGYCGFVWYESQFDYVTTEQTTQDVDLSTEGENANAEYNDVQGNQYNDSATHNEHYEESIGKRKLHKKVLDIHNKLIPIKGHEKPEVIPKEWYSHTRMDIDDSVLTKFVRSAMKQYKEWEEETKKFYEAVCCVFYEKGWLIDYNLMMCYLEDVQYELKKIYRMCEELNGTGYDVLYIVEIQNKIHEEYKEKMKKLKVQK